MNTSNEQTLTVNTGRIITWALGIITLAVMTLATCVADGVRADIRGLKEEWSDTRERVRATENALIRTDTRMEAVDKRMVDILAELKVLNHGIYERED